VPTTCVRALAGLDTAVHAHMLRTGTDEGYMCVRVCLSGFRSRTRTDAYAAPSMANV
jgi:hypothetical protein